MYQINLVKHRTLVSANALHWNLFLMVNAFFLMALLVVSLFYAGSIYLEKRHIGSLLAEKQDVQEKLRELQSTLPSQIQKEILSKRTKELAEQINRKKKFLSLFSQESLGNREGFSKILLGFAKQWVDGMWMLSLKIKDGGNNITLMGNAAEGSALPELLDRLKNEPIFESVLFKNFKINRDASGKYLNYLIQSGSAHVEPITVTEGQAK